MSSTRWNSNIQFPTDSDFVNRIIGVTFGPSKSSGNPMITVECEVLQPTEKEVGGEMVDVSGVKTINYFTTKVIGDDEKTAKNVARLTGTGDAVNPPGLIRVLFPDNPEYADKFDPENPDAEMLKAMKGKIILTQMYPEEVEKRKDPTSEQITKAKESKKKAQGDVMKNPITGKPIINYWPKIGTIFGLAPAGIGEKQPY